MARLSVSRPRGFGTRGHWLRHQLAVLRRQRPGRTRLSTVDRLILGLALTGVAAVPERHRLGETGHGGSMAPARLSALLALALEIWTALSRARGARADPAEE